MTMLSRTALAGLAGSILLTAMPADARSYRRHHDGVDAGDVIAGALIIGGIAAIASAASDQRDRYDPYDGRYGSRYGYGYGDSGGRYEGRLAVEQCVRAAQREARRYGGWARVTDVTRVDQIRGGFAVRGRLVVDRRNYGYDRDGWGDRDDSRGWDRYDRWGYQYDRYGDDYDKGRFNCITRYGRVDDVALSGLRG